jgi:DNA-binding CsgD family transcriptional regulator
MRNLFRKLDVSSRVDVARAVERGVAADSLAASARR